MGSFDIQEAVRRIQELPTLPSVLGQVMATMAQPDASALDLSRHIAADQSLSAVVLKIVNSAYYGFFRRVKSVTQAIVILGFVEVRSLVLTATAFRSFPGGAAKDLRAQLWRHALATAIAAERCAIATDVARDEAFVCGLLHDIGKVVLDSLYAEEFQKAAGLALSEGKFIRETEREVFGMDHAEVGGLLSEHWDLPSSIVDAIRGHHTPPEPGRPPSPGDITALANFIVHESGIGFSGNGCEPIVPEMSLAHLNVSEKEWRALADELQRSRDRIDNILGALNG